MIRDILEEEYKRLNEIYKIKKDDKIKEKIKYLKKLLDIQEQ